MKEDIQMQKAIEIIHGFANHTPLHKYMKHFFYQNKQMGSFDRKLYNALVYNYFRIKGNRTSEEIKEIIVAGSMHEKVAEQFTQYWIDIFSAQHISLKKYFDFSHENYFPAYNRISSLVDKEIFIQTHLQLPNIWIRIKQGFFSEVLDDLKFQKFKYVIVEKNVLSFEQHHPFDKMRTFAKGFFEIQDIASQRIKHYLNSFPHAMWWDCCAGSGGKSLLLKELQPDVQLLVSDSRESILNNLVERFARNKIQQFEAMLMDLENPSMEVFDTLPEFDGIIADVPCTGSGTWGRTPEWLTFFKEEMIDMYVQKQRTIVNQAMQKLKFGGTLIYITCSVFSDENENNIQWLIEHYQLQLEFQKYLQYSAEKGDTLFVASLIKK